MKFVFKFHYFDIVNNMSKVHDDKVNAKQIILEYLVTYWIYANLNDDKNNIHNKLFRECLL